MSKALPLRARGFAAGWGRSARVAVGAMLGAGIFLAACGSSTHATPTASSTPYVIGEIDDLTAGLTFLDVPWHQGLVAAVDGVNARGGVGGHKIKLISLDSAGSATTAVTDFHQLVSVDHAIAVVGLGDSIVDAAVLPLATSAHVPLIAVAPPSSEIFPPVPYMYEYSPSTTAEADVQLAYLQTLPAAAHSGRVAVFGYDTPQGQGFGAAVAADAAKFGFKVAGDFLVAPTATDYSTQAAQIAGSHATAIVSAVAGPSVVTLMKDLKAVGVPAATPITAFAGVAVPSAPWSSFAVVSDYRTTGSESGVVTYRHDVKAAGYDPSSPTVVEGYAGGLLVSQALGRCGSPCSSAALVKALNSTNTNLSGLAFGPVAWSAKFHAGPTVFSLLIYTAQGQPGSYAKPVTVYPPGAN